MTRPQLDAYAHLNTVLHRWDPRYKTVGLMALIFAFSFVRDLRLLPFMVLAAAVLFAMSRLPVAFLLDRLRVPAYFLLIVAVLLPFFSGETVIFELGPLAARQEGCLQLLAIAVRFICILTVAITLFGTTPFLTVIKAMHALGLPIILTDMAFFSFRYLFEIGDDLKTMQRAMKMRGFQGRGLKTVGVFSSLAGTILVRSYEQSDRVYRAMSLRGYGQPRSFSGDFRAGPRDAAGLAIAGLVAVAFTVLQVMLQ